MPRNLLAAIFLFSLAAVACDVEPPPDLNDPGRTDAGPVDFGFAEKGDAEPADAQTGSDAGAGGDADAQTGSDATVDGGADAGRPDATVDAGGDAGAPADSGVLIPDQDGDSISDQDEGNGAVDTDSDTTPDSLDADSDDDGIPDADEAGDTDPATPPIDTDGDGTPDFRDLDSDDDGIPDAQEGNGDTDGDGTPDRLDDDSDGDGIQDVDEGSDDPDGDGTPNFLDDDSDGDGILDQIEGLGDPDGDGTPNFLDDDSDGDSLGDDIELLFDPDGDTIPAFLDTDSDGDLIDDAVELDADVDGDGLGNWLDLDSDDDTIADGDEGTQDPDGDGIPSYLDDDSDGDLLPDSVEAGDASPVTSPFDFDFDGTPNFLDDDSDDDLISDLDEGGSDTDGDGSPDFLDIDSDSDSVIDLDEAGDLVLATAPVDTDNDGLEDFRDPDADGDNISDLFERVADTDNDGTPDRLDPDSDDDGVPDVAEAGDADLATAPVDTDGDGVVDFRDVDSDDDGLQDGLEAGCPGSTERLLADSDADGYVDPAEIAYGSDPCSAASGIDDFYFVLPPLGPPQNAPLVFDDTGIDRADLAINVDTTGSMGGEIANLRSSLSTVIIPGVQSAVPDPAFAVSSFEDYPVDPFASATDGDLPFRLGTRATTDGAVAQAAVNGLTTRNGLDIPESGVESLYQIATGAGTSWTGGSVAPFDPNQNLVPGVADGTIGGVGFRSDSLPIVVHVTDATSHVQSDYVGVDPGITAVPISQSRTALSGVGARVVTIANENLPRPSDTATTDQIFTDHCNGSTARFYGRIDGPPGTDTDWFELAGAQSGDSVSVEIRAQRLGSTLDSMIAVYDGTTQLALNDDIQLGVLTDSQLTTTLSGAGPFYLAITAYDDTNFDGAGATSSGYYFADVTINGAGMTRTPRGCPAADDADSQAGASLLSTTPAAPPGGVAQCVAQCQAEIADDPFRLPYGMSELTGAVIPTCAWDEFGAARPAGCGPSECCTGLNGAGTPPNSAGECPLAFEIDPQGTGIDVAMVAGIEALVNFSAFTITTVTRPDPAELASSGIDTTCFIHGVVPQGATPPNTCAPTPVAADLFPPTPELDSFQDVVPGTTLVFTVNAENRDAGTGQPCAPFQTGPQLFRAYIDVVADGVTVVDTRDVIIIIPPDPPTGQN